MNESCHTYKGVMSPVNALLSSYKVVEVISTILTSHVHLLSAEFVDESVMSYV